MFYNAKLDEKSGNDVKFRHMRTSAFRNKKVLESEIVTSHEQDGRCKWVV